MSFTEPSYFTEHYEGQHPATIRTRKEPIIVTETDGAYRFKPPMDVDFNNALRAVFKTSWRKMLEPDDCWQVTKGAVTAAKTLFYRREGKTAEEIQEISDVDFLRGFLLYHFPALEVEFVAQEGI